MFWGTYGRAGFNAARPEETRLHRLSTCSRWIAEYPTHHLHTLNNNIVFIVICHVLQKPSTYVNEGDGYSAIAPTSLWRCAIDFKSLKCMAFSSANIQAVVYFMQAGWSLMQIRNNSGPRIDLHGTLQLTICGWDVHPWTTQTCSVPNTTYKSLSWNSHTHHTL